MGISDLRRYGGGIEEGGWGRDGGGGGGCVEEGGLGIGYGGGRRYEGGGLIRINYEFTGKEHVEHNTTIG